MAVVLPYLNTLGREQPYSEETLEKMLRRCLTFSGRKPCYLEVKAAGEQRLLFFREKQIYSAAKVENLQFAETTIKEFFLSLPKLSFPQMQAYELNNKILHSMLILFQKKPSIKILTSLVDLDQLLDKIEEEKKSCIVCAVQDDFLALLRYEKGTVTALCHQLSCAQPKEGSFREDFLVKIYTLSAEKQLEISLYENLLVKYASDAKMIEEGYSGNIIDVYLSKPPAVSLRFKGKELGNWTLDKPKMKIGRTRDNDIVIDNLAVSRLHALIEEDKGNYYIKDCDSLNGTILNGKRVGRARLHDGDTIAIGKHELVFRVQEGRGVPETPSAEGFDQTVVVNVQNKPAPPSGPSNHHPRLVEEESGKEIALDLEKTSILLGSDQGADVHLQGLFIGKRHAEITREGEHYMLKKLGGVRRVKVGGKPVKKTFLKQDDRITIGRKAFIFKLE